MRDMRGERPGSGPNRLSSSTLAGQRTRTPLDKSSDRARRPHEELVGTCRYAFASFKQVVHILVVVGYCGKRTERARGRRRYSTSIAGANRDCP